MGQNLVASKTEAKMRDIYQELSNMAENINQREILVLLFEEANRHQKGLVEEYIDRSSVKNSTFMDSIKVFFHNIKKNKESIILSDEILGMYNQAISFLEKNNEQYKEFASGEKNSHLQDIFYSLAEESRKYLLVLNELVAIHNDSETWVRRDSFLYIDEY